MTVAVGDIFRVIYCQLTNLGRSYINVCVALGQVETGGLSCKFKKLTHRQLSDNVSSSKDVVAGQ